MRDKLIRYSVRYQTAGNVRITEGEYSVKYCGKPNAIGLAKHVNDLVASTQPGGCNAHLGALNIVGASLHDNKNGIVLATF